MKRTPLIDAELWLPVVGYEGFYYVSNLGRVKSANRLEKVGSKRTGGHVRKRRGRILKTKTGKLGYVQVNLRSFGRSKVFLVHRLVMLAFEPTQGFKEVNHIDGVKSNNRLDNLEWCTRTENSVHSVNVLGAGLGSLNGMSKLRSEDVLLIMDMLESGIPQTVIAKEFKVTNHAIFRIRHGYNWSHITGYERKVVCDVA